MSPIKTLRYAKRSSVRLTHFLKRGRALLVAIANSSDNQLPALRQRFPFLCNYTAEQVRRHRDELLLAWPCPKDIGGVVAQHIEVTHRVESLYQEWTGARSATHEELPQWVCEHWLASEKYTVKVSWGHNKILYPSSTSLPGQLAWGIVHNAERLGFCRNLLCKHPRYIKRRDDQIYCSSTCAKPAERERKRRWWTENRSKKGKQNGTHKTR